MRRFKSFSVGVSNETTDLDNAVNAWMEKHEGKIEIVETKLATLNGTNVLGNDFINITVIIWYEELEPVGTPFRRDSI